MKWLLSTILFLSLSIKASAYELELMSKHLGTLRNLEALPERGRQDGFRALQTQVHQSLQDRFDRLQLNVFKNKLIQLSFCAESAEDGQDGNPSVMQAFFSNGHICIYEKGLSTLLRKLSISIDSELISFILAHEISHFITELSFQSEGRDARSLNQNISIYTYNYRAFILDKTGMDILSVVSFEQMKIIEALLPQYMELSANAHAEVDAYTCLLMKKSGFEIPFQEISLFFNQGQETDALLSSELLIRFKAVQETCR